MPGQGGKPKSASAPEKSAPERVQRRLVDGAGQDQSVVLIGAHGLLAAAFAAHDDEAAAGPDLGGCDHFEQPGEQAPIEVGDDLANYLDLDALAAQGAHLRRGFSRGNGQVILARGAIDAAGDDLGAAGEEPQQVDILQDADIALAVMHRDAALVVFGHQHKSRGYEIIRPQCNDVKMRELAHRRFDRLASQHHRFRQVHAGDDADAVRRHERTGRCCRSRASGGRRLRWYRSRR